MHKAFIDTAGAILGLAGKLWAFLRGLFKEKQPESIKMEQTNSDRATGYQAKNITINKK